MEPRDAATVMLVRDTAAGMEVFMLRRNFESVGWGGLYLFPGGAVDEARDRPPHHFHVRARLHSLDVHHRLRCRASHHGAQSPFNGGRRRDGHVSAQDRRTQNDERERSNAAIHCSLRMRYADISHGRRKSRGMSP